MIPIEGMCKGWMIRESTDIVETGGSSSMAVGEEYI